MQRADSPGSFHSQYVRTIGLMAPCKAQGLGLSNRDRSQFQEVLWSTERRKRKCE